VIVPAGKSSTRDLLQPGNTQLTGAETASQKDHL
jgi:hypothetical protein